MMLSNKKSPSDSLATGARAVNENTGNADDFSVFNNSTSADKKTVPADGKKKRTSGQKRQAERQRVFASIVYPESAPQNWKDILSDFHVSALISPLHDKDVNPSGEPKKPHYHVMLIFESPKNFDTQVKPIFDAIGAVGREIIHSQRGYARYLCHLDNPEKAQYNTADIVQLGGADYSTVIHLPSDDNRMLCEVFDYIRVNRIMSLAELLDVTAINNQDWFNMIALSKAYIVDKYIKSLQWEYTSGYIRVGDRKPPEDEELKQPLKGMDVETGEVIPDDKPTA